MSYFVDPVGGPHRTSLEVHRRMSSGCASRLRELSPRASGRARWGGSRRDGIMAGAARGATHPPIAPKRGPMSPDDSGSVTHWLGALRGGELDAAQAPLGALLWPPGPAGPGAAPHPARARAAEDEADAAPSAFDSFCRAATEHRFPRLDDHDDLCRLLVVSSRPCATRSCGGPQSENEKVAPSTRSQRSSAVPDAQ